MQTMVPLYGFGGGGGTGATLTVTAPAGVTVTVSKDGKSKTKVADSGGAAVFKGLSTGTWTVSITDGINTSSMTVEITADYAAEITFDDIPEFTYTGDYEIVNDSDEPVSASPNNWKIRFLTSGTLTFTKFKTSDKIDVFLVGGGGGGPGATTSYGGGGGGYTQTGKNIAPSINTGYEIVVGAGGAKSARGGTSSAFNLSAEGGYAGSGNNGGAGGSGGAGKVAESIATDGADGEKGSGTGGKGQGTTTREFAEASGRLYASGGAGLVSYGNKYPVLANTGNGGHCGGTYVAGGSGIVIIRNAREVS